MVGNCVYIDSIGIFGRAVCMNRRGNVNIPVGTCDEGVDWS
jgi:hypothetical protein